MTLTETPTERTRLIFNGRVTPDDLRAVGIDRLAVQHRTDYHDSHPNGPRSHTYYLALTDMQHRTLVELQQARAFGVSLDTETEVA